MYVSVLQTTFERGRVPYQELQTEQVGVCPPSCVFPYFGMVGIRTFEASRWE